MPSGPEMMRNFNNPEEGNIEDLFANTPENPLEFPKEEVGEFERQVTKELTPEAVAKVWEKFASYEKKTILSGSDSSFEKLVGMYEELLGNRGLGKDEIDKKVTVMRAIRKLIKADDPRADLIDRNV